MADIRPSARILLEADVRALISRDAALAETRRAFQAFADGQAVQPPPLHLSLDAQSEAHIKGGWIDGSGSWAVKVATGFYDNARRGLPSAGGCSLVFDAETGELRAALLDNGFLTDLRTGAAGALAADLLARPAIDQVAVIGTGTQARYQLAALLEVRSPHRVLVYGRDRGRAQALADEAQRLHEVEVEVADSVRAAVEGADLVVTTTPAAVPLLSREWVAGGTHVTAIGSDMPEKQELEPALLAAAAVLAVDSRAQASACGELHHAIDAGLVQADDAVELGEILLGRAAGRSSDAAITVADLTGVGVVDAALAGFVASEAARLGIGLSL